jgi:glutathione reductase (NADPH)
MDADLFVIGGGSAGVRAARVAAEHGARVVIAEEDRWGGTCVVRGCIPKKLMVYAAELGNDIADARAYGWQVGEATCDMAALHAAVASAVDNLSRHYALRLERAGVQLVRARARVVGPHAVEVEGRRIECGIILVATGGAPEPLEVPGRELAIDSDLVFRMTARPERLAVVGGGYIAVELAHVFRGLGSQVSFIHRGAQVLRGFDADVRAAVTAGLAARGIAMHLEERITDLARTAGGLRVGLAGGGELHVDAVLAAVGRRPRSAGFGLEEVGVELGPRGAIVVDEESRTSVPSIYAVGDCTDRKALTPIAIREGQVFADTLFGGDATPGRVDYDHVPTAVFALPPAAAVGLTETEARARCAVDVYRHSFRPLRHSLVRSDERTLMKLVVDRGTGKLLGAHIVGDDAPEIIQTLAIAVRLGATKADLDATMPLHPTTAEELMFMRRAE